MAFELIQQIWNNSLQSVALFLGVVNGIILLWNFRRDRPILSADPVLPDTHQWFFALPDSSHQGQRFKRYGFLAYISVKNRGLRDVALGSRRLHVNIAGGSRVNLGLVKSRSLKL